MAENDFGVDDGKVLHLVHSGSVCRIPIDWAVHPANGSKLIRVL